MFWMSEVGNFLQTIHRQLRRHNHCSWREKIKLPRSALFSICTYIVPFDCEHPPIMLQYVATCCCVFFSVVSLNMAFLLVILASWVYRSPLSNHQHDRSMKVHLRSDNDEHRAHYLKSELNVKNVVITTLVPSICTDDVTLISDETSADKFSNSEIHSFEYKMFWSDVVLCFDDYSCLIHFSLCLVLFYAHQHHRRWQFVSPFLANLIGRYTSMSSPHGDRE